jgi:hypothetical protein
MLLGLPLNTDFAPSEDFYQNVNLLLLAVRDEHASWKLIWAFLRCIGYTGSDEPPAPERRFNSTRTPGPMDQNIMKAKKPSEDPAHDINYRHFPSNESLPHTDTFQWDDFEGVDRRKRIPELIASEEYTKSLRKPPAKTPSRSQSPEPGRGVQIPDIPEPFDPCAYFNEHIVDKGKDKAEQVTKLSMGQVQDSIAAVVRAFNELHPSGLGFTMIASQDMLVTSANNEDPGNQDRITVALAEHSSHTFLMLIKATDTGHVIHVIDSAPWTLTKPQRAELYNDVAEVHGEKLDNMFWVSGPQQTGVNQEEYFITLNAWSVILGLPLNLRESTPGPDFFRDAHNIIQVVLRGGADWLVIWAFLRCHRFVGSEQAPEAGRRFAKTIPTDESDEHKARMLARAAAPETAPRVNTYDHFRGTHLRWNEDFEWDSHVEENRKTGIQELIRLGKQGKGTGRTNGPTQPPNTPSPCEQFRQKLDALLQDKRIASDLRDFRAIRKPTMNFGAWLNDEQPG